MTEVGEKVEMRGLAGRRGEGRGRTTGTEEVEEGGAGEAIGMWERSRGMARGME